jgi:hypothetical protein
VTAESMLEELISEYWGERINELKAVREDHTTEVF